MVRGLLDKLQFIEEMRLRNACFSMTLSAVAQQNQDSKASFHLKHNHKYMYNGQGLPNYFHRQPYCCAGFWDKTNIFAVQNMIPVSKTTL